jgi:excisionase family DNA binding protein
MSTACPIQPLITKSEVAVILGVTVRTVTTLISTKQLPVIRLGRAVRVRPLTLQRFIRNREKRSIAKKVNQEVAL